MKNELLLLYAMKIYFQGKLFQLCSPLILFGLRVVALLTLPIDGSIATGKVVKVVPGG
jgi:hypothetical protein